MRPSKTSIVREHTVRTFSLGVIAAIFTFVVGGLAVTRLGLLPITAAAQPPDLEIRLASRALDASVDRRASRSGDPLPLTDESLIRGMKVYTINCAVCHGTLDIKPSPLQHSFYPPPPQLILVPPHDADWRVYYVVRAGIRYTGMPAWNETLSDQEMWAVSEFLTRMQSLPPAVQSYWKNAFELDNLPKL